jgi:hypothetical protein
MSRRLPALVLGAALLASASGCRSSSCGSSGCGSRPGLGLFTSNNANQPPCTLVGSGSRVPGGCYDAITGQPVPCPPPGYAMPGGPYPAPSAGVPGFEELPPPAPSNLIPNPNVPFAPPSAAPGMGANSSGAKGTATVVKNGTNQ